MKIAVVNEVSASLRNKDLCASLEKYCGEQDVIYNCGMACPEEQPQLTYLHTGLMTGLLLGCNAADLVIGGCGTGQGYINAAMQYPGVSAVLLTEPLDAWLAKRINHPNCISLPLNKGYGWAAERNLDMVVETLLAPDTAEGYPEHRIESQKESRAMLMSISYAAHKPWMEILSSLNPALLKPCLASQRFLNAIAAAPDSALKSELLSLAAQ